MIVLNVFLLTLLCFSFSLVLFWLVRQVPKTYAWVLVPAGFYFLLLTFISFLVMGGYAVTNPVVCENLVNSTIETGSGSNSTTVYTYVDSCASVSLTAIDYLYVIYLWTFYGLMFAAVITLYWITYKSVRDLF